MNCRLHGVYPCLPCKLIAFRECTAENQDLIRQGKPAKHDLTDLLKSIEELGGKI